MRDRAVREIESRGSHVFAVAHVHKAVTNCLFVELLLAENGEAPTALEFLRAYRHLFDGGSLDTLPVQLIEKRSFLTRVRRVLAGKQLLLEEDQNERRNHHRDDEEGEEGDER